MMSPDKILERVRKLYAQAESAKIVGSLEEAEAFMTKVQALMTEYSLSMTDLQWTEVVEQQGVTSFIATKRTRFAKTGGKIPQWMAFVSVMVAEAFGCALAFLPNDKVIIVFGPDSTRQLVVDMTQRLIAEAMKGAIKYASQYHKTSEDSQFYRARGLKTPQGPRHSYLLGFASSLWERLNAEKTRRGTGTSLMRINQSLAASRAAMELATAGRPTYEPTKMTTNFDRNAFEAGKVQGAHVPLHEGVTAGVTTVRGQLTTGKE